MSRLAIVTSHVIQYQDPLFRLIAAEPDIDLTVLYCSRHGLDEFRDADMGTTLSWDMDVRPSQTGILVVLLWAASAVPSAQFFADHITAPFHPIPGGHGCVNAAQDPRLDPFGLVCSLQRRFSYKSETEPKLHMHTNWAWGFSPPYLVYNQRLAEKLLHLAAFLSGKAGGQHQDVPTKFAHKSP